VGIAFEIMEEIEMMSIGGHDESQRDVWKCQVLNRADLLILIVIVLLLVFPTWRRGGTIREYITPYLGMAVAAFFIFLLSPYLRRISHHHGKLLVEERIRGILKDPIFYIGALFLVLLYIQWLNSGKVYTLENKAREVLFSPAPIDWLPGAVNTLKSWDMLVWFFPVFAALLMVRHGFPGTRLIMAVSWSMTINSAFLGIIGIIAPLLGKKYLSWLSFILILPPGSRSSFSTFGYSNHAASFFLLHLGLACGLFLYRRIIIKTGILLMIILLEFYALQLTRSRFGIIFSWVIAAFFVFYWLYLFMKRIPKKRLKSVFITWAVIFLTAAGSIGFYLTTKAGILSELSTMTKPGKFIKEESDIKLWYISSALDIWRHHPIFGVGGGGFGDYLLYYERPLSKKYIVLHRPGKANVHNDFVQFLCEFGIVGVVLLAAVLVLLAAKLLKNKEWKQCYVFFGLLGMSMVLIQGLIDLPFRNPAVLISFAVMLTGYGTLKPGQLKKEVSAQKRSFTPFVTRFVNFYTIIFFFIIISVWWALTPVRQKMSRDIVREVEKSYYAQLIIPPYDHVTPGKSGNASPSLLRSLWPAELLYGEFKDLHLLSARINFDLYRDSKANNEEDAGKYLLKAFRCSLAAQQFTNDADIDFINIYTAVLDELGYYLEESRALKALLDSYPDDIRLNLLVREYYVRRPHLIW
jgi:O-antigen ligase